MLTRILRISFSVIYMAGSFTVIAQKKSLSVGEHMPNVELKNVINYPKSKFNLSDFRGKCIILDFWNHNCHYCLASFRNIDSMQKKFAGKLQIILVNKEDRVFTENFFRTKKKIKPPAVPLATGSTELIDLFPREGYPYSVWIDSNGIIRQMVLAHNITSGRLTRFIEGEPLELDNATRKIFYGPLFNYKSDDLEQKIGYFSCITRYINDLNIGLTELSKFNDSLAEISSSCSSVVELYKKAYREGNQYDFNGAGAVVLKVKDSSIYVRPKDPELRDDWDKQHSYNYSLFLPVSRHKQAYKIMQEDLYRYFGLKASILVKNEYEKTSRVLILEE